VVFLPVELGCRFGGWENSSAGSKKAYSESASIPALTAALTSLNMLEKTKPIFLRNLRVDIDVI
jgi:hypothetical protein